MAGEKRLREALLGMADDLDGLADAYTVNAPLVAEVCDEVLDRSGGLLGRVRQRVHETGRSGGYPALAAARRDPEPVASADAAWAALRTDLITADTEQHRYEAVKRHRPAIEAAIRGTEAGTPLDAAWAEAEAALPEGWTMAEVGPRFTTWTQMSDGSIVWVVDLTKQIRAGRAGGARYWRKSAEGVTPAAALLALAAALREHQP